MILDRPDGRWSNDCDLCGNSRRVGLPSNDRECPWCRSVRLRYGSYWYLITKRNEHLFPPLCGNDAETDAEMKEKRP